MTRKAVEDCGMGHLVVQGGEAAAEIVRAQLEGDETTFDPLLTAWSMVSSKALEMGGLYLMSGDYCPVCEAMKYTASWPNEHSDEPVGEAWVENHYTVAVVEAVADMAREKGLIPPKQ